MKKILLILIFSSTTLFSQEKVFKLSFFSDESSISVKRENSNTAWVKNINRAKKVKNSKTGKFYTKGGDYSLQFWECNCSLRKIDITDLILYNVKGEIVDRKYNVSVNERIVPETIGETIFNVICGNEKYYIDELFNRYSSINPDITREIFDDTYENYGDIYIDKVVNELHKNEN